VPSIRLNDNGSFSVCFFILVWRDCVLVGVWCRVVVLGRYRLLRWVAVLLILVGDG